MMNRSLMVARPSSQAFVKRFISDSSKSTRRFLQTVPRPVDVPLNYVPVNKNVESSRPVERDENGWNKHGMPRRRALRRLTKETLEKPKEAASEVKEIPEKPKVAAAEPVVEAEQQDPSKRRRRRQLRPRKALITVSPSAVKHLRSLLDEPVPKLIRIGVKNRGCSGLSYHFEYVEKPDKFDEVVKVDDDIKVLIDSKALFSIIGSEMDYIDDKVSSRFVFKNPNSKGSCGCGESFMV